VKLDKSIIKLLWVFAVVLLLNAVPSGVLIPEAFAQSDVQKIAICEADGVDCATLSGGNRIRVLVRD